MPEIIPIRTVTSDVAAVLRSWSHRGGVSHRDGRESSLHGISQELQDAWSCQLRESVRHHLLGGAVLQHSSSLLSFFK